MNVRTLPSGIRTRFVEWCRKNGCAEDQEALSTYLDEVELKQNNLIMLRSKKECDFVVSHAEEHFYSDGVDYPKEWSVSFDDDRHRYTIIAFMWTGGDTRNNRPFFVAYKRKLLSADYKKQLASRRALR